PGGGEAGGRRRPRGANPRRREERALADVSEEREADSAAGPGRIRRTPLRLRRHHGSAEGAAARTDRAHRARPPRRHPRLPGHGAPEARARGKRHGRPAASGRIVRGDRGSAARLPTGRSDRGDRSRGAAAGHSGRGFAGRHHGGTARPGDGQAEARTRAQACGDGQHRARSFAKEAGSQARGPREKGGGGIGRRNRQLALRGQAPSDRGETTMKRMRYAIVAVVSMAAFPLSAQSRRPLQPDDIFEIKNVGDPRISPDGAWIAYTVSSPDKKDDTSDTGIYLVSVNGGAPIKLTGSKKPETSPRWSPDGRYLAFLSSRDSKKTQVYLLDRRGGEATAITDYKTGASAIAWSPDSTKLALLVPDPDPSTNAAQAPAAEGGSSENKPK